MKISVLIAAYNAAPTLARALESVRAQTHRDWEIIVVEDGSRDGSEALVRAAAAASTQTVRYENFGFNQGVATARNRLMQLATGDAFAFLDADDHWSPGHLERASSHFSKGAGLVVTGVRTFDLATGETIAELPPSSALDHRGVAALFEESVIITSSSVLLSRETWVRTGAFDAGLSVGEDRDYWLRALLSGAILQVESARSCHYAKHADSTMARTHLVAAQTVRFYEKHSCLSVVPAGTRRRLLARSLSTQARLLRATEPRRSVRLLTRALTLTPWNPPALAHIAYSAALIPFRSGAPRVLLVADRLGGQCRYSGIHQLARFFSGERGVRAIDTPDTFLRRCIGKVWSLLRRWPARNQSQAFTELETDWIRAVSPVSAVHFLVGENHLPYLEQSADGPPLVVTLHLPASRLEAAPPRTGRVHTLILLSSQEQAFYAGAWGARQTVVIPHGVDTDFFQPQTDRPTGAPTILIVGRFLRDFPLTAATVLLLAARHPHWCFDFVVPESVWLGPDLASVRDLAGARWHDRVDDETLRGLYQNATCHLTPFQDCTANNALVESLACGLPVVTSDRGGVRDYGADTVYPLAADHSAAALASLCERYASEPEWRAAIAKACRAFALGSLSWHVIARRHLALYAQITRIT